MAYKNKTYVAFDGDNDIKYYNLMKAWKQNDYSSFNFYDAHDINSAYDSSTEESIKTQLRKRMAESKIFVLLIGSKTKYLYKFVKWEIEQAIKREIPIICVNINNTAGYDSTYCPPVLKDELAIHISFKAAIMQYALENWSNSHETYKKEGKSGPYKYNQSIYDDLGV